MHARSFNFSFVDNTE